MMHNRKTFKAFVMLCVVFVILSIVAGAFIWNSDLPLWAKIWLLK